jgi:subtilisin family serine protease
VRRALLLGLALAALAAPADALAGRWAVGAPAGQFAAVAAQLPGATTLVPGRTLVVTGARPHVRGASYVTRLDGVTRRIAADETNRTAAFANLEPFHERQWYLEQDHAWDYWPTPPDLPSVKVAVIDSGLDAGHPEFAGRVFAGRSFVGGTWRHDTDGHGTFVAGILAASPFNGIGIAGLGFNVQLVIGKVVKPDGVSPEDEAKAITWAVGRGAQVINLSLGGVRDPEDASLDTFSLPERDAIAYAVSKGVVVVSAVGNADEAPTKPWRFADWPSSLPHVIGVSALASNGSVPAFSNRDPLFVDLAAPGEDIFSTVPRNLIDKSLVGCSEPYSDCGPAVYRGAIGTSFAAPQVSAAAALLLGEDPSLEPDQVAWLLERSATDVTSQTCRKCIDGRDSLTGWGRLNVLASLEALRHRNNLPPPDAYEPNDDAGADAAPFGPPRTITATLDYWDDPTDVYSIKLAKGDVLTAHLTSSIPLGRLQLWSPGTVHIGDLRATLSQRAPSSPAASGVQQLAYRASRAGTYYLSVRVGRPTRARPVYRLAVGTRAAT